MSSFKELSLSPAIQKAIEKLGFTQPTSIQEKAIPKLIAADSIDFHGQAQTGTGKTFAFGLPVLQKIDAANKAPQALIIAPTRELVHQITDSLKKAAYYTDIVIESVYGGVSIDTQVRFLRRGVHIVVGTPGRLNDHLRRKTLSLKDLKIFVLDEADIMLDMGFKQEIDGILNCAPQDRQIWLFSATVKRGIMDLKRTHMKNVVSVAVDQKRVTTSNTKQHYCLVSHRYRLQALCRLLDVSTNFYGVIFCQTKILTAEIAEQLTKRSYRVGALHGDMDQKLRNKVIKKFKDRSFDILVATDVAARGIDVADLSHVINYSFPDDQESYVHRIGRTGRAGKEGTAITFIGNREMYRIKQLKQRFSAELTELKIPSVADIIKMRAEVAGKHFMASCEQEIKFADVLSSLKLEMESLPQDKLIAGALNMLAAKYLKGYDKERDIPTEPSRSEKMLQSGAMKEVMFHIGKEDGVTRDDIVNACLSVPNITMKDLERVRVINRRSFVIASANVANTLLAGLRGMQFNGRPVRINIASADRDGGRRDSGRRDGGRGFGRRSGSSRDGGYGRRSGGYSRKRY